MDETTGYLNQMLVRAVAGVLLSCFGYNSGAQAWVQLFDHATNTISGSITDTDNATGDITDAGHGLTTGQLVSFTGITGLTSGWARVIDANTFRVFDSAAHAGGTGDTGLLTPTANDDTGSWALVPLHTFAIGAADNFSVIVPVTGINFGRGLVLAVSTTGPFFTLGTQVITVCGTLLA